MKARIWLNGKNINKFLYKNIAVSQSYPEQQCIEQNKHFKCVISVAIWSVNMNINKTICKKKPTNFPLDIQISAGHQLNDRLRTICARDEIFHHHL